MGTNQKQLTQNETLFLEQNDGAMKVINRTSKMEFVDEYLIGRR